jgi:hypothetical protein
MCHRVSRNSRILNSFLPALTGWQPAHLEQVAQYLAVEIRLVEKRPLSATWQSRSRAAGASREEFTGDCGSLLRLCHEGLRSAGQTRTSDPIRNARCGAARRRPKSMGSWAAFGAECAEENTAGSGLPRQSCPWDVQRSGMKQPYASDRQLTFECETISVGATMAAAFARSL